MKVILILFQLAQHYLLMQPIQKSIKTGDFSDFRIISKSKISVHMESPFDLKGYFYTGKFIQEFSSIFNKFETKEMELSSQQIEDNFAIQSYYIELKNKRSERIFYYKFIIFMNKDEVKITRFDKEKKHIVFAKDPGWNNGSEFEVTGAENGANNGWYKIINGKGKVYTVIKSELRENMVSEISSVAKAKAWKLYYLRGLNI